MHTKRFFITYGDKIYEQSKRRIARQAAETGLFDRIITFGREDVSEDVAVSPLFKQKKGGGYWLWKPNIVLKTLAEMDNGDILVYADSGCTVHKDKEWSRYFDLLKEYNALVFLINGTNEEYTRRSIFEHFSGVGKHWHKRYQIAATFFLLKKTPETVAFVQEWQDVMVSNPQLVMDVADEERGKESLRFVENRHDQSIFTALAYKYQKVYRLKVLFNHFEGGIDRFRGQALIASRISDEGSRGENRSLLRNILLYLLAKPYRLLYQTYWVTRR
ncbi:hypothetical protein CLV24_11127 [Pontibacter ummariensis]|uniref:Uncharacterized protein n=2 Tax=Pontibacter ummariensis TaxID=1610492 RepID=A0A239GFY0_9BACT|nr:hypothetical protein [Pontibacter ummariensis]PRY11232.1 hypothetical protein CLV24_11127 [Pontibacter ummariensis]SNS67648.1 hypothetical protein SAMN06296052_11127 [Pontibacter ummariensis]